jgi:hypothetical protein
MLFSATQSETVQCHILHQGASEYVCGLSGRNVNGQVGKLGVQQIVEQPDTGKKSTDYCTESHEQTILVERL